MAEIGAGGTGIWVKGGGGKPSQTIYLLRQVGVHGIGPISMGGETLISQIQNTGQSLNQVSFSFDGVKGAYNANISQQFVNSIVEDPPGGSIILPYVLYGMSNFTPIPLLFAISLHQFLDEKIGSGGIQVGISDRRSTHDSIGGFIGTGTAGQDQNPLLNDAGPSSLSEIMDSVPYDPFIDIDGNQSGTGKGKNNIIADNLVKGGGFFVDIGGMSYTADFDISISGM